MIVVHSNFTPVFLSNVDGPANFFLSEPMHIGHRQQSAKDT